MTHRPSKITYYSGAQRPVVKNSTRFRAPKKILICCIIVITVVGFIMSTAIDHKSPQKPPTNSTPAYSPTQNVLDQQVKSALNTLPTGVTAGVVVVGLESGRTYTYGENARYDAASVGKLVTATAYLRQIQDGKRSLKDRVGSKTVRQQLQAMITESDNDAWRALNDQLGHDALDAWGRKVGMKGYSSDDNQMYPADIGMLLTQLYKGDILDNQKKNLLMSWLLATNNSLLRQYSAQDIKVYAKAGWLDDRHNEAAIIDNGKHPYVLAVFARAAQEQPFYKDQQAALYQALSSGVARSFQ